MLLYIQERTTNKEIEMTTKMNLEELKSFIKENAGSFGGSRIEMGTIAELAKENELVKIHSFELNLNQEDYQACEEDEHFLHFTLDYSGYLHGVNINFFSMAGAFVDWSEVEIISHKLQSQIS